LYLPPIHCLALNREETRALAESPVLVHAFGNNRAGMYQYLKEELMSVGAGERLGGVVFDSGPGIEDYNHSIYN